MEVNSITILCGLCWSFVPQRGHCWRDGGYSHLLWEAVFFLCLLKDLPAQRESQPCSSPASYSPEQCKWSCTSPLTSGQHPVLLQRRGTSQSLIPFAWIAAGVISDPGSILHFPAWFAQCHDGFVLTVIFPCNSLYFLWSHCLEVPLCSLFCISKKDNQLSFNFLDHINNSQSPRNLGSACMNAGTCPDLAVLVLPVDNCWVPKYYQHLRLFCSLFPHYPGWWRNDCVSVELKPLEASVSHNSVPEPSEKAEIQSIFPLGT